MNKEHRKLVNDYISNISDSAKVKLYFNSTFQDIYSDAAKSKLSLNKLIILTLLFTNCSPSCRKDTGGYLYRETDEERNRSVLDIYRHIKSVRKSITIFSVMHSLYNVTFQPGSVRNNSPVEMSVCSTIERRVFYFVGVSLGRVYDDYDLQEFDEFNLQFKSWRYI